MIVAILILILLVMWLRWVNKAKAYAAYYKALAEVEASNQNPKSTHYR